MKDAICLNRNWQLNSVRICWWNSPNCLLEFNIFLICFPSVKLEMCLSDSSYCQLLFSLCLSSRAFLNMHAPIFFFYHLPKIKWMSFALASVLLCNSALFVVDPVSRLDPTCSLETGDRQTQKAHQPASQMQSECPPTPITRIASVSSYLSQTQLLLLLFARHGCRSGGHTVRYTLSSPPL